MSKPSMEAALKHVPNPVLQPTRYSRIRQPPRAAELKRSAARSPVAKRTYLRVLPHREIRSLRKGVYAMSELSLCANMR